MGLVPRRETQHLLNGPALPQVGGSTVAGLEPGLMSHQIRFRLSGHRRKGSMGNKRAVHACAHPCVCVQSANACVSVSAARLCINNSGNVTKTQQERPRDKEPRYPEGIPTL